MATSRSSERTTGWLAGVRLFSGRPDPEWDLPEGRAKELLRQWETLEPAPAAGAEVPALGYRGCFLRAADAREWSAFAGAVTLRKGGAAETRHDTGRQFERAVLRSAPPGLLPRELGSGAPANGAG